MFKNSHAFFVYGAAAVTNVAGLLWLSKHDQELREQEEQYRKQGFKTERYSLPSASLTFPIERVRKLEPVVSTRDNPAGPQ